MKKLFLSLLLLASNCLAQPFVLPTNPNPAPIFALPNAVNASFYGAVADGVTDCTIAISNAMQVGNVVFLPPDPNGRQYVIGNLVIPSGKTLYGQNTRLLFNTNLSGWAVSFGATNFTAPVSNVWFEGFDIDGGMNFVNTNSRGNSNSPITIQGNRNGLWPDTYYKNVVKNVTVHGFTGEGVHVEGHIASTVPPQPSDMQQLVLESVSSYCNWNGFDFVSTNGNATYLSVTGLRAWNNQNGLLHQSSNIGYANCIFTRNNCNINIVNTGVTYGHSVFSGCQVNHGQQGLGLVATNVNDTIIFTGCAFIYCDHYLTNCGNLMFTGCTISSSAVVNSGAGMNLYVTPMQSPGNGSSITFTNGSQSVSTYPWDGNGTWGNPVPKRLSFAALLSGARLSGCSISDYNQGSYSVYGAIVFTTLSINYAWLRIPNGLGWKKMALDVSYIGAAPALTNVITWESYAANGTRTQVGGTPQALTGLTSTAFVTQSYTNSFSDDTGWRDVLIQDNNPASGGAAIANIVVRSVDDQ